MTGDMVLWRARCGESRTSGSEGGPGRRANRKTRTAPWRRPYFGALLWDAVPPLRTITVRDFQRQRPTILRALDHAFFDARLARTSSVERRVLRAIAAEGEGASIQSLLQLLNLSNHGIQPLVARLEAKGLLYRPERGRIAFTVPLFGDYLRRNAGDR
jgi:MarR family